MGLKPRTPPLILEDTGFGWAPGAMVSVGYHKIRRVITFSGAASPEQIQEALERLKEDTAPYIDGLTSYSSTRILELEPRTFEIVVIQDHTS